MKLETNNNIDYVPGLKQSNDCVTGLKLMFMERMEDYRVIIGKTYRNGLKWKWISDSTTPKTCSRHSRGLPDIKIRKLLVW